MVALKLFVRATNVPILQQFKIGFFGVASIALMNYNLKCNSVGFYQLSKLCNIPVLVIYKFFFLHQKTPSSILFSLTLLLIGIAFFSINDVELNFIGTIVAIFAVITTCASQTMTHTFQAQYNISGTQLNHLSVYSEFLFGLIASLFIEFFGESGIIHHQFYPKELALIFLSGINAICVNMSTYVLIGRAGPITYQVVGHVKTILIFIVGLFIFPPTHESNSQFLKKIIGLVISMVGVILYTYFKMNDNTQGVKVPQEPPSEDNNEEEELGVLPIENVELEEKE